MSLPPSMALAFSPVVPPCAPSRNGKRLNRALPCPFMARASGSSGQELLSYPLRGFKGDQPRWGTGKDRTVCLFCARVVRFRSAFVQLSFSPLHKKFACPGEASVPPGTDLKEKIQATFNVYHHETVPLSSAVYRDKKWCLNSTIQHPAGEGIRNLLRAQKNQWRKNGV